MDLNIGDSVFVTEVPGSSLEAIALFSIATEDPNPIHTDPGFARECGFDQVIQQGPMTTAYFAQLLAKKFGADRLVSLDIAFTAPVFPQEPMTLSSKVASIEGGIVQLDLLAVKACGVQTAKGVALARLEGAA